MGGPILLWLVAPHEKERWKGLKPRAPVEIKGGEFLTQESLSESLFLGKVIFYSPYLFLAPSVSKYNALLERIS